MTRCEIVDIRVGRLISVKSVLPKSQRRGGRELFGRITFEVEDLGRQSRVREELEFTSAGIPILLRPLVWLISRFGTPPAKPRSCDSRESSKETPSPLAHRPGGCYPEAMLSCAEILGPEGRIAKRLADCEHRPEQLRMAEAVDDAIDRRHHLVVEAGTGVGKSFAYLVPAILGTARKVQKPGNAGRAKAPCREHVSA